MRLELEQNKEIRDVTPETIRQAFVGFGMAKNRFARLTSLNGDYIQAEGTVTDGFMIESGVVSQLRRSSEIIYSASDITSWFIMFLSDSTVDNIPVKWINIDEIKKTSSVIKLTPLLFLWIIHGISFLIIFISVDPSEINYVLLIPLILYGVFSNIFGRDIWSGLKQLKQNDSHLLLFSTVLSIVPILLCFGFLITEILGV